MPYKAVNHQSVVQRGFDLLLAFLLVACTPASAAGAELLSPIATTTAARISLHGNALHPTAVQALAKQPLQILDARTLSTADLFGVSTLIIGQGASVTLNLTSGVNSLKKLPILNSGSLTILSSLDQPRLVIGKLLNAGDASFSATTNLTLSSRQINNDGTISGAGSLRLITPFLMNSGSISAKNDLSIAGIQTLVNSGQIGSLQGNLSVDGGASRVAIIGTGGSFYAPNGAINVNNTFGGGNLQFVGGNYLAPNVNVTASGSIRGLVQSIEGTLSSSCNSAHFGVAEGTLQLGKSQALHDPVYFNDSGDILINGNIVVGESLAILASGNITTAPGVTLIQARTAGGRGQSIELVAGAQVSGTGSTTTINTTPPNSGFATGDVTLTPAASTTGGDIDFSASPSLRINANSSCGGCSGANVVLAAYENGASGGHIHLAAQTVSGTGTIIDAGGRGAAGNGNISLIAGTSSGIGIETGTLLATSSGGTRANTGVITLSTSQPKSSDLLPIVFSTNGNISSSNQLVPSTAAGTAEIDITGDISARTKIDIASSGRVDAIENVIDRITVPGASGGAGLPVLADNGKTLLVPWRNDDQILVINAVTRQITGVLPVNGTAPVDAAISPNGRFAYVAYGGSNSVGVYDLRTRSLLTTIPVGTGPTALALSTDGKLLFVSAGLSNQLNVIDTGTRSVVKTIPVGVAPTDVTFNNSDGHVFVANAGSNNVTIYNPKDDDVQTISLTFSPNSFGRCPCGTKLFITDPAGGLLHAFSTESNSVLSFVPVGTTPLGLAISATGSSAFVANNGSNNVSVLATLPNAVDHTVPVGAAPFGAAAGFIGKHQQAFVTLANNEIAVLQTPLLTAPTISATAATGDVNFVSAPSKIAASAASGAVVVESNGTLTSLGGTASGGYQLATTTNLVINAPVTADVIDFHAINGRVTNNSIMTAKVLLFFATPRLINNGSLIATNSGGDATMGVQAPLGLLNVLVNSGASMTVDAPSGIGDMAFNPAGGMVTTILGRGTLSAPDPASNIDVVGSDGQRVRVSLQQIDGDVNVIRRASDVNIQTRTGELSICGCIDTSSATGNGGAIRLNALGGGLDIAGGLNTEGSGTGHHAGSITLRSRDDMLLASADMLADGLSGARGGRISVSSRLGRIDWLAFVSVTGDSLVVRSSSSTGDINLIAPITMDKRVSILSSGANLTDEGSIATAHGAINLTARGSIAIADSTITAGSSSAREVASLTIRSLDTKLGSINIGENSSLSTAGPGGRNIVVAIGRPSLRVGPIPVGVVYSPTATSSGPFYFGTNGIAVVNPSAVSMTATNRGKVLFNTGSLPASAITLDASTGPITFTAVKHAAPADQVDFLVDVDSDSDPI